MNQFQDEDNSIFIDFEEKINQPQTQEWKSIVNYQEIELSDLITQTKIRDKYLESEKQNFDNQIQQLLKHLDGLEFLAENKMDKFIEPENAFQRNCVYIKNYTFPKIKKLRYALSGYRYSVSKIKDLMQYYNEIEPKMKEFYKEYHHIYFEVLMFMERYKYYKKLDDDRDTKIILDIIN